MAGPESTGEPAVIGGPGGCIGQGGGHGGWDERGICERGQVDPDHAIRKILGYIQGDGQRKARLTHPTRTRQGQQRDGLLQQE